MGRSRGCVILPPYPPRPGSSCAPSAAARFTGFWVQYKFDDVRTLVEFDGRGELKFWNRFREPLRAYPISPDLRNSLLELDLAQSSRHVLDGGLLRQSNGSDRTLVLWDLLVHEGHHLLGSAYSERYDLLGRVGRSSRVLEGRTGLETAWVLGPRLWLARVLELKPQDALTRARNCPMIEGVVLKNPAGRLERAFGPENNGSWSIKIRLAK